MQTNRRAHFVLGIALMGAAWLTGPAACSFDQEPIDLDGDGYAFEFDCNDHDPATYPGAFEVCTDRIDNNCDSLTDEDEPSCMPPGCTDDGDCEGGTICIMKSCRTPCKQTRDCPEGYDCAWVVPNQQFVCFPEDCRCAPTEVCIGTTCQGIDPCQNDGDCSQGVCTNGICEDGCQSSVDCGGGLECAAVTAGGDEHMTRSCVVPVCNCPHLDDWCLGGDEPACFHGTNCTDCPAGYACAGLNEFIFGLAKVCRCETGEICGPQ